MNKLRKYFSKSDLMNLKIIYGEEIFKFNLFEELTISEDKINAEAKEQPSAYGFLGLLAIQLKKIKKEKENDLNMEYSRLYLLNKDKKDPSTGRPMSKDFIEAKIVTNLSYQAKLKILWQAEADAENLDTCVKSFEQRANMIQTLSANVRKDRS